ncbi:tRNA pseudouridine32 synthase/23S rRNA pseudouridine746 synthase [Rhodanobacter sp. K2T2]|uniref:pseudouridine synthase n=1 Tax=Rhodanobacter sp. K2T2 TaxID=2723085 RepID=UPI00182E28CB|nr:pseudouridine synthase [Rhodanobacter sp. K2T2]NYE29615.1 tRNA pseudouridine32 synthase/23S rRNA pseudouridine746 synthase [Rhodanobacter sp. K2T2]
MRTTLTGMSLTTIYARDADASTVHLPAGPWPTVLDSLCATFTSIPREQWFDRMARGRVLDARGVAITPTMPHPSMGLRVHYYREVVDETSIPFAENVLHVDEHLVVADKPHFLPVIPSGGFVEQTLLRRLMRRLDNPDLVPLHRIDRATAGLVLFSANRTSRSAYQALFQQQRIEKRYEALAPPLPEQAFPLTRRTRLVRGEPFFRTQEVDGEPNSETRIEVMAAVERGDESWRYALYPITGKKHQLRVHMAALGAPILNDPWYPVLTERDVDDYQRPLKLLAKTLAFVDPLSGERREFESRLRL